jgi:UDP-glucose:(heptosyl)LPS alpha-1,3-glucosyltransferase
MRLAINFRHVDPDRGGAETYVVDLCRQLTDAGHDVDLYAESWRDGVLPAAVRCVRVEAPGATRRARIWKFARNSAAALAQTSYDCTVGMINTWAHDVIIPQGGVHQASVAANAKRFPTAWQRGLYRLGKSLNPKWWTLRAIERRQYALDNPVHVVAVSNMVREHLIHYHNVPKQRIHLIPNAIDVGRINVAHPGAVRCTLRNRLGLAPSDLVGLFVGHNPALKGLKQLLLALNERAKSRPERRPIHLLVCGGGELAPYRRLVGRLGLRETVHLIGFLPEIRDAFWSSDFFASPTYYDPCSLVVFEALACGLPVITTSCNGAGELITDGREGYVITRPDALGELVTALEHMTDDAARKRMSAAAQLLGRAQSFENHVTKLVRVFEEVASARSRQSPLGAGTPHGRRSRRASSRQPL